MIPVFCEVRNGLYFTINSLTVLPRLLQIILVDRVESCPGSGRVSMDLGNEMIVDQVVWKWYVNNWI